MSLRFNLRVKFVYDYDWVEDDLSVPNIVVGKKQTAKVLQSCKPKIWENIVNQYGIEPFEVPFVQVPISSDLYKWKPWYEQKLNTNLPPLCDGALNDTQFSFKWIEAEFQESPIPTYIELRVNAFEYSKVSEYYVMQTNVRRVLSDGKLEFVTSHRVLQYTSNF